MAFAIPSVVPILGDGDRRQRYAVEGGRGIGRSTKGFPAAGAAIWLDRFPTFWSEPRARRPLRDSGELLMLVTG